MALKKSTDYLTSQCPYSSDDFISNMLLKDLGTRLFSWKSPPNAFRPICEVMNTTVCICHGTLRSFHMEVMPVIEQVEPGFENGAHLKTWKTIVTFHWFSWPQISGYSSPVSCVKQCSCGWPSYIPVGSCIFLAISTLLADDTPSEATLPCFLLMVSGHFIVEVKSRGLTPAVPWYFL